jgi:hypothetical protein
MNRESICAEPEVIMDDNGYGCGMRDESKGEHRAEEPVSGKDLLLL